MPKFARSGSSWRMSSAYRRLNLVVQGHEAAPRLLVGDQAVAIGVALGHAVERTVKRDTHRILAGGRAEVNRIVAERAAWRRWRSPSRPSPALRALAVTSIWRQASTTWARWFIRSSRLSRASSPASLQRVRNRLELNQVDAHLGLDDVELGRAGNQLPGPLLHVFPVLRRASLRSTLACVLVQVLGQSCPDLVRNSGICRSSAARVACSRFSAGPARRRRWCLRSNCFSSSSTSSP